MKKITLILLLSSTFLFTEEMVESTAVSKVMERFSELSTIESTPIEESITQKQLVLEKESVVSSSELKELAIVETIKTAKFENSDIAYPPSGIVDRKVEKSDIEEEKIEEAKPKSKNLADIEANARRVIEEEMKKVEEAKKSALKNITKAMKLVEDAKKKDSDEF